MIVYITQKTIIKLSADEIKQLVIHDLEQRGYRVDQIQSNIETVYDGFGDPGTDTFTGMTITANVENEEDEIN